MLKPLRTGLLALLPATLIATGWRQLELPAEGREIALVALLGVAVALIPGRRRRLLGVLGAFLAAVGLAFSLSPLDARPFDGDRDYVGPLLSRIWNGTLDYYEVSLPFNPAERPRMHGIVLLAVFAFTLAASLAIARRRAILAAAITFAGAAWPVTLIRDAPSTARGALLLVSALILLLALRGAESRRVTGQTALVGAGVLLAALVAVSSPAVAKGGFLNWEQWEPYTRPQRPVEVTYVWRANYDGIEFPKQPTTVLTIEAPRSASYWRATTLDSFTDGHWTESSDIIEPVALEDRDALIDDPLVPPAARDPENWIEQDVRVRALQDRHLVGATVPMAYERGEADSYSAGVAHVGSLRRDQEYKVWSYVVQPRPRQLAASPPDYPEEIATFLGTPSGFIPPFGAPGRGAVMRSVLEEDLGDPRYRRLLDVARQVVGSPRNAYGAVIALEAWFRSGEFTYDESPPVRRNLPPLVAFVDGHRRGYCQHFAGAMALMLRYLGIPARVGAGFTTGRFNVNRGDWTVSDTNAHTWVEAWFAGYGWLPFDPTPGRGRLLSSYTASSFSFDVSGAQGALVGVGALGLEALRSGAEGADRLRGLDPGARSGPAGRDGSGGGGPGGSLIGLILLIAAGLTAALWAFKLLRRRARYLTGDPRRLAGAVRLDLVDFLVDQRLPISASATPAEVGRELERSLAVDGKRLAETLAEARYGPEAAAAEAVARARRELRAVRSRIRRRLGFRDRLRGLLSLRSLGLGSS
jgi:transglutaminase-like putative cysteine protease